MHSSFQANVTRERLLESP